ncbi:PadR family transcriptional regulator [Streptomyces sp. Li-HN-5-11]|uniref:PadR family transcriptional regulator n=1 Tax=Streptomyces sp. Li-HN-5-11 TaxID=3075432 RepID=UPI0028AB4558|nr:PadR family transcriptional regulator [Streptomyces sp. Li-HN-5-11]WNM30211.1 PadR family transcriptional regulator [Streptomyces sp. Li-HN-5-11]
MPLHHAVLALLAEGPNHGYELKGRFEEAIGPQWGGLNIGHLYQILDRLVRDGYVTRSQVTQSDRPDKTRYTLTAAGRDELRDWATSAWVRTGGFRDELFLKLFGASSLGPDALGALVTAQRQTYLSELAGLTRLRRTHANDPLVALLIEAAIAHTKADLNLVDTAAERLSPLAERNAAAEERTEERAAAQTRVDAEAEEAAGRRRARREG